MKWIDFITPDALSEALDVLGNKSLKARPLAGGTDLIVQLRSDPSRLNNPELIVDMKRIPELNELSYDANQGLKIGAAVPCYKIYSNNQISKAYPGLMDSAELIGGIQIQGRASIGGNLCNATPSADSIPALIALSAVANIQSSEGARQIPVEEFCTGPIRTVLQPGEILVSINIPAPKSNTGAKYIRFIPRNEMDIAVAGAGVSVELSNGSFASARIALSSVAPTPLYVKQAGESLIGQPVSDDNIEAAAQIASDAATPITDMRGTAEFRKHLCGVLTRRALKSAIERAQGGK